MQTKSKILSILFIVVIYSLGYIVSSCVDPISQKRAYWKSYLDSLDKSCPITLDNAISINGVKMYHDSIEVRYKVNDDYYPMPLMKAAYQKSENDIKITRFLSFVDNLIDSDHKLEDLISMNASIKEHITGNSSFDNFDFIIGTEDIKNLSKEEYSESERNFLRLKSKIIGESCRCPYNIENGMIMENVSLNREYVTFHIKVDESIYPMEAFRIAKTDIKRSLKESMLDAPSTVLYGDMLAINKCNLGIRYMYVGNSTGESITITFDSDELPSIEDIQKAINKNNGIDVFNNMDYE